MTIKLVDNWRRAWRWVSVNCMVLAASIQGAWVYIPDDMRDSIPSKLVAGVTISLLVLGVIGRLFKKEKKPDVDKCDHIPEK